MPFGREAGISALPRNKGGMRQVSQLQGYTQRAKYYLYFAICPLSTQRAKYNFHVAVLPLKRTTCKISFLRCNFALKVQLPPDGQLRPNCVVSHLVTSLMREDNTTMVERSRSVGCKDTHNAPFTLQFVDIICDCYITFTFNIQYLSRNVWQIYAVPKYIANILGLV